MGAIYFHSNHGRRRPRGAPLRGKVERACTRDAPMGEGGKGACTRDAPTGEVERACTRDAPAGGGVGKVELRTTGFLEGLGMT